VLSGGEVVVTWKEVPRPAGVGNLGVGWSDDGASSWTTAVIEPEEDATSLSNPWVVVDGRGAVHFARMSRLVDRRCVIGVARSLDGGETWSGIRRLHDGDGCGDKPSLEARGNRVMAVYTLLLAPQRAPVQLAVSRDGGTTWDDPVEVAPGEPAVRVGASAALLPDGRVVVAWWAIEDGNVEVTVSPDGGPSWSDPIRVNPSPGSVPNIQPSGTLPVRPAFPSLVAVGGTLLLAWPDHSGPHWNVVFSRSSDGGESWSPPAPFPGPDHADRWLVALATDPAGGVHAAWYDNAEGATALRYVRSDDGGWTWTPPRSWRGVVPTGEPARLGDYLGVAAGPDGEAFVAWTAVVEGRLQVWAARAKALEP
jgi:hypothetical protein